MNNEYMYINKMNIMKSIKYRQTIQTIRQTNILNKTNKQTCTYHCGIDGSIFKSGNVQVSEDGIFFEELVDFRWVEESIYQFWYR